MSERGVGSLSWIGSLAKEGWGLGFADSDPWHDARLQDCRARLEDQTDAGLVHRTRAWARAFVFDETMGDVLQFYYAPSD